MLEKAPQDCSCHEACVGENYIYFILKECKSLIAVLTKNIVLKCIRSIYQTCHRYSNFLRSRVNHVLEWSKISRAVN